MIDKHSSPLKSKLACLAFVDKPVKLCWCNLQKHMIKILTFNLCNLVYYLWYKLWTGSFRIDWRLTVFHLCFVHSFYMFSEFIFPFKLFSTFCAREIFLLWMSDHMNLQFVLPCEAFITNCARESLFCVECPDVFSYLRVFSKCFLTMLTSKHSIFFVIIHMFLQTWNLFKKRDIQKVG